MKEEVVLFEPNVLIELAEDTSGDTMKRYVEGYLAELEGKVTRLGSALSENNQDQVVHIAHDLKGSSAAVGASALSRLAKQMENSARVGQLAAAQIAYKRLPKLVEPSCDSIRDWLADQ
ncbi:Hpt domain-containing protein [Pokkaliibacter sp. CJK22405]|uniref:Hpt domain-containing protein n=1 Tax=Pokkaliibacter sp. CJK22405 TaxID=3384615 RepID=UPI0039850CAA